MKTKLLIATTNKKKLTELETLLTGLNFELHLLSEFPKVREVPEDAKTFAGNATLKATGYARQTGLLTLGEDSGLCVDALEGAPGVYSARFAGPAKSDAENNAKLLRLLEKVPDNCRNAHFASAVCVAEPDRVIGVAEGQVHGFIAHEVRGKNGFGYDPVFFYPAFKKTFGEVASEQKHTVSHRAQALAKARQILENDLLYRGKKG